MKTFLCIQNSFKHRFQRNCVCNLLRLSSRLCSSAGARLIMKADAVLRHGQQVSPSPPDCKIQNPWFAWGGAVVRLCGTKAMPRAMMTGARWQLLGVSHQRGQSIRSTILGDTLIQKCEEDAIKPINREFLLCIVPSALRALAWRNSLGTKVVLTPVMVTCRCSLLVPARRILLMPFKAHQASSSTGRQ